MGMVFLMTMLTLWLDDIRVSVRIPAMAVIFAALILVHHHSMLVAGILLAVFIVLPIPIQRRFFAANPGLGRCPGLCSMGSF